ncbi:hypothetical protein VI817_006310 [Penicillium citrinum]|nr:hypothetical protein VI817_006310 [Penicillium citrinum]
MSTDASPPSYDELLKRYETAVGDNPTPEKYIEVAGTFTDSELDILAETPVEGVPPVDNDEDLAALKQKASREMQSDYLKTTARIGAEEATEAALRLRKIFETIHEKIIELDSYEVSGFEPEMRGYVLKWRAWVTVSNFSLPYGISLPWPRAQYFGLDFDELLLPVCDNDKVSKETKIKLVNNFLTDTARHREVSENASGRIRTLKTNFNTFVAKFDDWGKVREGELRDDIVKLNEEIQALQHEILGIEKEIEDLQFIMKLVSSLSLLGLLFGGWTAVIIGLVGAIGVAATAAAIAAKQEKIQRQSLHSFWAPTTSLKTSTGKRNEIQAKNGQIEDKEKEIKFIQETRSKLRTLRDSSLETISADVITVDTFWQRIEADTYGLLDYVENDSDFEYIEDVMDYGITTYQDLGVYVAGYGRAVIGGMSNTKKSN